MTELKLTPTGLQSTSRMKVKVHKEPKKNNQWAEKNEKSLLQRKKYHRELILKNATTIEKKVVTKLQLRFKVRRLMFPLSIQSSRHFIFCTKEGRSAIAGAQQYSV